MKSIDWTPGFSSRSLKSVLRAGVPGNSDVTRAVKSAVDTGYTTDPNAEEQETLQVSRRGRRMLRRGL